MSILFYHLKCQYFLIIKGINTFKYQKYRVLKKSSSSTEERPEKNKKSEKGSSYCNKWSHWFSITLHNAPKVEFCEKFIVTAFSLEIKCFIIEHYKNLERLMDRFLREGTLTRHPLQESQHAYQGRKSTKTALHLLVTKIQCSMKKKQFALAVFMDIQGAFDSTTFAAITGSPRKPQRR